MGRKIECEIHSTTVELAGRLLDGVEVTCAECGHVECAAGESIRSIKRCLAQMRENCPAGESNFYVTEETDE